MRRVAPSSVRGIALTLAVLLPCRAGSGYVEAPYPLGRIIQDSTNILVMRVESVDKAKNLIVYRKVRDLKGTHPGETIKHNIGRGGFHPREWQNVMAWAEVGRTAMFFHNRGAGEVCIKNYWYQIYAGAWWRMSHAEPYLLRSFAGRPEKLASAVAAILAGQEVAVPCMVDGNKNALQLRTARLQRMKASLRILDYNAKRDFVGWGVEEFRAIAGMGGFTHYAALSRVSPGAAGVAPADFDGNGKPDFCLFGAGRVVLLQNGGGTLNEIPLPLTCGARAADWADCNGDGRVDLLLATPAGAKLLLNQGKTFKDASASVPQQGYCNVTAAAWIDYDGDKRPDILVADGFRGLRLYRNRAPDPGRGGGKKVGNWYYAGPFDNVNGAGFAAAYPPEKQIDLAKQYVGKGGRKVIWRAGSFPDGQVNSLALFKPPCNENSAVYLYRELNIAKAAELPVSLGSDDTLTVWLNGVKLLAQNVPRPCQPDQAKLTLKLKGGKNALLLKVCNTGGDFAFYFSAKAAPPAGGRLLFEDVSDKVKLGANGIGGKLKGDHLAVADVNADGRPDFLYSAGAGLLAINTPGGFVEAKGCGISFASGKVAPAFGDFNGDGRPDLLVPQRGKCKLFANAGKGRFVDVTAKAGALAEPLGGGTGLVPVPTCAVWADLCKRGRVDLLVGCLRGPNRYFRNNGDGSFTDATEQIGFYQRIFNTVGIAVVDINADGVPDVVFNNEGQESAALLGNPARLAEKDRVAGRPPP